jgi:hypothetical protein
MPTGEVGGRDTWNPIRGLLGSTTSSPSGCSGEEVSELSKRLKPGDTAPASGQYEIRGPRGGRTGQERTVTRGEPLPPTPRAGQRYEIVDRTRNRAGRGK